MRKIREVLRLTHACGLSERRIALAVGLSRSTVKTYVQRAAAAGIAWPLPTEVDDATLDRRLFPPIDLPADVARPLPNWKDVHKELKRRGVTLQLVWEEYQAEHVDGYCYSHFCERYRQWLATVSPTMRQTHAAGEKLFVDWAGDTAPLFDTATGEERRAHIFVAVLGASNYTYAEARWSEALPEWIGAHVNAFAAIGGVPRAVVCDNLKAGVRNLPLRARHQPHLSGPRHSLRYGNPADPTEEATRQGQGRSSRANHRALRARALAQPALLFAHRAQCGDPRNRRRSQCPRHAQTRR
jgi:transposase